MKFLNKVGKAVSDFDKNIKLKAQVKAEKEALKLEEKAKYADALNKRLKRKEKAQKTLNELKNRQAKIRKQQFKGVTDLFANASNNFDRPSSNDDFFALGSGKKKKQKGFFD